MKPYFIPFLAICLLLSSCIATVPSIPTSHIPEKAHEVNVSAAFGIPRFSANIAYNPHKNFGFVLAGNTGKESLADLFIVGAVVPNQSRWRTYLEGGVAGYYHFNDWFAGSITPTIGQGRFFIVDTRSDFSSRLDTLGGRESRQALFFNSRFKIELNQNVSMNFRLGLKVANSTMKIETSDVDNKALVGQNFRITTVEPMVYSDTQFGNFTLFSVMGVDLSQNHYSNSIVESSRSPFYMGIGLGYTFNGLNSEGSRPQRKR